MHVAWILYGSLEQLTGGTIYDERIVRGLEAAHGDRVDLVSVDPARADAPAVVRYLAKMRPDVVVGDELCFRELAVVFRHHTKKSVLLVHHLTCWEQGRRRTRMHEAMALRRARHVIATSHVTRDRLVLEGHRRPIDVIVPGADRLPRAASRRERGAVRFLFVGALIPRKRVLELVHAARGFDLHIVGSSSWDPDYARSVREAAGAGARFLGEVDAQTLAQELADADVLVMPSSLEGYGIAATEAIAAGLPVVAAKSTGLVEAMRPCPDASILIDSIDDLEPTLRRLAADAALRTAMRDQARRAEMPSWANAVTAFRASLAKLLDR
jgi:glycosyltransferase involved in cell wall biosynthesis